MLRFLALLFLLLPAAVQAQSYDDLLRRTQSSLSDYMKGNASPTQTAAIKPAATATAPARPALVKQPERGLRPFTPAPLPAAKQKSENINPLLSGWKLNESYHGIRRELGMMVVSYAFDEQVQGQDMRALTDAERKAVNEVLLSQLPRQVALRFEQASHPQDAYLHIVADDLSKQPGPPGGQLLGYASYPNPMGGKLVIDRNLCAPLKPDCELLKGVVRHEIGHTLGLQHPDEAGPQHARHPSLMQAVNARYNDYQPADIASLQNLYGVANGARPVAVAQSDSAAAEESPAVAMPSLASLSDFSQLLMQMLGGAGKQAH